MIDYRRTQEQLIQEVENLRRRIADLENSESERKQVEQLIRKNLWFQQMLMDAIPSPIFYKDAEGIYMGGNKAFERLCGRSPNQIMGKTVYDISPPDLAEIFNRSDKELFKNPGVQVYETSVASSSGLRRTVIVNKATFTNDLGDVAGLVGVIMDITERKQVEEQLQASLLEKATMLKEIHHRVKNNLQVIQSLLNLQTRKIKDPEVLEAFKQTHDRIQSMALVHEKLYGSSDLARIEMADYLRNLSSSLFYSYGANLDGVDLKVEVEEVQVGIDKAIPLGLIINELVTNALKHGFPAGGGGEIRVELAPVDEGMIRLSVGDNGVDFPGEVDFQQTASTGFQLVMALVQQLEGTITIHQEGGIEFRVTFPKK